MPFPLEEQRDSITIVRFIFTEPLDPLSLRLYIVPAKIVDSKDYAFK